jgi:large subunit ribosomal protein L32
MKVRGTPVMKVLHVNRPHLALRSLGERHSPRPKPLEPMGYNLGLIATSNGRVISISTPCCGFRGTFDQEPIMAVQQNKKSPSKRGMHRSHNALVVPGIAVEPTTGEIHLRHHISPTGFYRGRKVLKTKSEA